MDFEAKKAWLKRYRDAGQRLRVLEEDMRMWEDIATHITPRYTDDIKGKGGTSDKIGEAATSIAHIQAEITEQVKQMAAQRAEVLAAIMSIDNAQYVTLLYRRYILCDRWEDIAAKMRYDVRHVTRLHGLALAKLKI